MMVRIRLGCLLIIFVFVAGCQTNKKLKSTISSLTKYDPTNKDVVASISLFEAQHADLFFPFSYKPQSFQLQEQQEGEIYTISIKVKTTIERGLAEYKQHMELYGWRKIIAVSNMLLFEKPHARCIVHGMQSQHAFIEITLVYANLIKDELYQPI
jgi:hypothetical protein